jgi:hypothetical protein
MKSARPAALPAALPNLIGCALVATEFFNAGTPAEAVYYVDNNYRPTTILPATNRGNGGFFVYNADPGATTVTASVGSATASETSFVYPGGVTLNIVVFGGDVPPTPADCPDDLTSAVIDGNSQQPVSGATVQLLQATSGQPFSPAISAITATDGSFLLLVWPTWDWLAPRSANRAFVERLPARVADSAARAIRRRVFHGPGFLTAT